MCVAWKISRSLGCYVDNESIPLKILFIFVSKPRALAPLQIPASLCEGPIYLLLCWVIVLLLKSTSWRAPLSFASITVSLHWVWLDLFCHELQCLVSPWSSGVLCIYVTRSQEGLARYHFVWEPPIMYVAWKISRSHSFYVESESILLKIYSSLF